MDDGSVTEVEEIAQHGAFPGRHWTMGGRFHKCLKDRYKIVLENNAKNLPKPTEQWDTEHHGGQYHEASFDASGTSSGVYFYRIQAGEFISSKSMLVVK